MLDFEKWLSETAKELNAESERDANSAAGAHQAGYSSFHNY